MTKMVLVGTVGHLPIPTLDPVPIITSVKSQYTTVAAAWTALQNELLNTFHVDTVNGPVLDAALTTLSGFITQLPTLNGDMVFSCSNTIGNRAQYEELLRLMRQRIEGSNLLS